MPGQINMRNARAGTCFEYIGVNPITGEGCKGERGYEFCRCGGLDYAYVRFFPAKRPNPVSSLISGDAARDPEQYIFAG